MYILLEVLRLLLIILRYITLNDCAAFLAPKDESHCSQAGLEHSPCSPGWPLLLKLDHYKTSQFKTNIFNMIKFENQGKRKHSHQFCL